MTMLQQRLWNKPIRTETNSAGPGSTARPFTTSHRTNECVPSIFPFSISSPPTSTLHFHPFHFPPSLQQAIIKYLISSPPSLSPSLPAASPPLPLCAEVIVDAKARGPPVLISP